MTRFALTFIALFASACAADTDASMEDTQDNFRASLEEGDMSTDRNGARGARIVDAIMNEYGQLASSYGCSVESVVYGVVSTKAPLVKGYVLDLKGRTDSTFRAALRFGQNQAGSIYGATKSRDKANGDYFFKGLVDGQAIEATMISTGEGADLELFADLNTRGSRAVMKGVIVDCE